jgi:nicotinate-nucleotide pyrophosphorylase (carboxylating)
VNDFSPPYEAFLLVAKTALAEDMPAGDPTGALVGGRPALARLVARSGGVIAGMPSVQPVLDEAARRLGSGRADARITVEDGSHVGAGECLAEVEGPARTLLGAERVVLNIVAHLSGVATLTAAFVEAVAGTGAVVRDTRKTLPGLRALEKYAVRCGGGNNHRSGLSDAILVKDNHIAALGGVKPATEAALASAGRLDVEVEVGTLDELREALATGARLVLLDNMGLQEMAEAVRMARQAGAKVEASGGITLETARQVAGCGVDYLAVGALTHSAPALDVGLDWSV